VKVQQTADAKENNGTKQSWRSHDVRGGGKPNRGPSAQGALVQPPWRRPLQVATEGIRQEHVFQAMNLDTLKPGQVTVQDATIVAGQEPKWSRQRGTKLHVHASRLHPRVRDIQINISGSMVYFATDWDPKLQALVRYGQAIRIGGITGPWREIRHPDHPKDAKATFAMPIQSVAYGKAIHCVISTCACV